MLGSLNECYSPCCPPPLSNWMQYIYKLETTYLQSLLCSSLLVKWGLTTENAQVPPLPTCLALIGLWVSRSPSCNYWQLYGLVTAKRTRRLRSNRSRIKLSSLWIESWVRDSSAEHFLSWCWLMTIQNYLNFVLYSLSSFIYEFGIVWTSFI